MCRLVLSRSLTIIFCAASLVEAQSPPPPAPAPGGSVAARNSSPSPSAAPTDLLDAADLEQAIALLKSNYVDSAALSDAELNRAMLAGLLGRLGRGVLLLPARPAASPTPPPIYREIIAGHIGYLRPGALDKANLQDLETTLRNFAGKKVDAVVLDLRGSVESHDFAMAAEFAKRFAPMDKPLFALRGPAEKELRAFISNQAPIYNGFLVLLVDGETAGASEALAGALHAYGKAIVIGQRTAGRAVEYSDLALPSGKILRVAVAEAILPDQRSVFPEGLEPDLPVVMPVEQKRQIFQQSLTNGMARFVFEADRPHLNEAALLSGTNPEIEEAQSAQERRARGEEKSPLHDTALQRAVDLITSVDVYRKQPGRAP